MIDQGFSDTSVQNESAVTGVKKPEKQRKSKRVLDEFTELYRHYDLWNRLLYVGVSSSSLRRLWEHQRGCCWSHLIATIKIERWESRSLALAAEKQAVRTERPYFNKVHAGSWRLRRWEP